MVYTANFASGNVSAERVDANTGALTPPNTLSNFSDPPYALRAGSTPDYLAADPFGMNLYVLDPGTSAILKFTVGDGQADLNGIPDNLGRLYSLINSTTAGNGARSLTIGPTAEFLYVPNSTDNTLSVFRIDQYGSLTAVPGSPFVTDSTPMHVAVDPTGRFVYVANCAGNSISAYRSDGETGALTALAGSPFHSGNCPFELAMDPAGGFVLATNSDDNTVSRFNIDATSGALTAATPATVPTGHSPFGIGIVSQTH
jgi:6-phosphogluconolactonase (cycloisomerase 2 family)